MAPSRSYWQSLIFRFVALDLTLLTAIPPTSRPKLLRGRANGETVSLALLGSNEIRRRRGLVRSRSLFLNETGNPHFDSLTIEHNGILAAAKWDRDIWDELFAWFAGLHEEADELYVGGSLRRLPKTTLGRWGLGCQETCLPSYSVDLYRLRQSEGELNTVLSATARQKLRRSCGISKGSVRCGSPRLRALPRL